MAEVELSRKRRKTRGFIAILIHLLPLSVSIEVATYVNCEAERPHNSVR